MNSVIEQLSPHPGWLGWPAPSAPAAAPGGAAAAAEADRPA